MCCDVPDRNTLIKDDDDDDENDCEQSDIVSILLNMAYIPEEVASSFRFESGFHKKFRPAMDGYLAKRGKQRLHHSRSGSKNNSIHSGGPYGSPESNLIKKIA